VGVYFYCVTWNPFHFVLGIHVNLAFVKIKIRNIIKYAYKITYITERFRKLN